MRELGPGIGLVLLGLAQAAIWFASRTRVSVWNRNVEALRVIWSPRFATGYAGASIILAVGLMLFGAAVTLSGWLTLNYRSKGIKTPDGLNDLARYLMLTMPPLLVATALSAYALRPRFLFPAHANEEDAVRDV